MKAKIHPEYHPCKVTCGCGNTFETGATIKELHIEICSVCHPFYTGKQKFVDTAGRIEKFNKKFKGFDTTAGEKAAPAPEAAAS
jgi:large subunit ribosomal protein L31